jgi:16S rRNA processing protein RimM
MSETQIPENQKLLSIGKVLNFVGLSGEVKVGYSADKKELITNLKRITVVQNSKEIDLTIKAVRFYKQHAYIKFNEINTLEEAIGLKNAYLKIPKTEIKQYLDKDEFLIDDLMNKEVFDDKNNLLGVVTNIVNIKEEDILAVTTKEGKEILIPFVKELVPEINLKENKIIVNNIPGLLD